MNVLAGQLCKESNISFEDCYRYQYVISKEQLELPGFSLTEFGNFLLYTGKDQHCQPLHDQEGELLGYAVGIALTGSGQTFAEEISQFFSSGETDAIDRFENHLVDAVGRFVIVARISGRDLFYQDASGMMGGLYNRAARRIASTLYLSLDEPLQKSPAFFDPESGESYCEPILHFSPDDRITRINPSFRFDLNTAESERFWPRAHDSFEHSAEDYAAAIDEIISIERNVLSALVQQEDVSLSMSGGYDSRAIFACATKDTRREFVQIFTHINNMIGWSDAKIAADVAGLDGLGIDHFIAPNPRAFGPERQRQKATRCYELASGTLRRPPQEVRNGIANRVVRNAVVLRGQQIPILKGFGVGRVPTDQWTDDYAISRIFHFATTDQTPETTQMALSDAIRDLYRSLPVSARCRSVDLLMIEAINGPELAGNFSGFTEAFYISPFNSRRFVQLFAGFNLEDRLNMTVFHHLLLRADARVCGLPVTHQVKRLSLYEDDTSVTNRFLALRRQRGSFKDAMGIPSDNPPIWRFSIRGGSRKMPFRQVRHLMRSLSSEPDKSDETE